MNRLRTPALHAVLLAALLVSVVGGSGSTHAAEDRALDELTAVLDLDSRTRAAVAEVIGDSRAAAAEMRQAIREQRRKLRALLAEDEPDEEAVMACIDELTARIRDAWKLRVHVLLEVRLLLTPDQRRALAERRSRGATGACRDDIETLCPEAVGLRAALRCLRTHHAEIGEACRATLRTRPIGRVLGFEPREEADE